MDHTQLENDDLRQTMLAVKRLCNSQVGIITTVTAQRDALLAVVEAIEWVWDARLGRYVCPSCLWTKNAPGHTPDCRLAAALAQVRGA